MSSRSARRYAAVAVLMAAGSVGVLATPGSGQTQTSGALTATRFALSIDGSEVASFSELSTITSELAPTDYMISGDKQTVVKKLPGAVRPPTLVLKRGATGGLELAAWHEAARRGQMSVARKNCVLTAYDTAGKPVARYLLTNAWPFKLEISGQRAGSTEILYETASLTAEGIQRVAAR